MEDERQGGDDQMSAPNSEVGPQIAAGTESQAEAKGKERVIDRSSLGVVAGVNPKKRINGYSMIDFENGQPPNLHPTTPDDPKEEPLARFHVIERNIARLIEANHKMQAQKLHDLSFKLDEIIYSFSEPRIRDILSSLLLLHDLLDQMADSAGTPDTSMDHAKNYRIVLNQIRQILELNGIKIIPTDIDFDENLHRAVTTVETNDPSEDGKILRVYRQGFKSVRRVLRYSDVEVQMVVKPAASASSRFTEAQTDETVTDGGHLNSTPGNDEIGN
jgi:molecular chaperone GrpE (heat shock protein)